MPDYDPHSIAGEPLVDADHPWLGLLPFREKHRRFFFGRDREIADLFERVRRHPLTVLFGPSGLGKTSLLNAGLCPRLRDDGWLPVLIRLRYPGRDGESAAAQPPALLDQVAAEIAGALEAAGHVVPGALRQPGLAALWPLFHDTTAGLCGPGSPRLVLVLDQFEEIFTLGEDEARARDDAARLRDALADLVENRPPPALARQLELEPGAAVRFDFDAATCRVALVVREDYLARLERWRRALPSLLRNRMELRLLDGPRAFDAVVRPARLDGRNLVSDEVGTAIVRAVAGKGDDKPLDEISAVPPFLSLLCAQLNERRIGPRIEADLLVASREHILQSFYTGCFVGLPGGVRETIEDLLLSPAGFRESPSADTVHATLLQRGVVQPVASLRALEDARLITSEERGGIRRIELTHDVLTKPVSDSRDDRHDREKSEQLERERVEAEARTKIRQERIERTEGLINYLLNSLPKQVPPTSLGGLFTEVDRYYSSLGADEREAKEALSNRAVLAFNIGTARKNQEDAEGALQCLQEAVSIWGRLGDVEQKNRAEREIREVQTLGERPLRLDTDALSGTFDIFVCYSRRDNQDGIITALVSELERIHRAVTGRDLIVFLDQVAMSGAVIWEQHILQALSKSRMFMACLSPSYFQSEWCRREWESFLAREVASSPSGEGIVPVLCWDVPEISGGAPGSQMTPMMTELRRRQFIDLRPLFHEGTSALRREEVQRSLNSLVRQVVSVRDRVVAASSSPTTIPPFNRRFVGRREELAELRRQLINSRIGTIVVIHGLGGTGKTEVAFAYAHAFAAGYPGGRFIIRCEGKTNLRDAVLGQSDFTAFFRDQISDEERKQPDVHFAAVTACLRHQVEKLGHVLLVLDSVTDPALLNPAEIAPLATLREKVHLLATTRLSPSGIRSVSDGIAWLALGELPPSDAVELLRNHRAFVSDEDNAAAADIVRRLGGFTLAVESVAAFLAQNRDVSYSAMLERLQVEGGDTLDLLGKDADVQLRRHNGERSLSAVLAPTLATLAPIEKTVLEYASLFAPDYIAVPWLRTLSERHYSELRKPPAPGHPDPWHQAVNRLLGLRLLSLGADERDEPCIVRCHRLVQEIVRRGMTDEPARCRDFYDLAKSRSAELEKTTNWQEAVWELPVLEALAQRWAEEGQEPAALLLNQVGLRWKDVAEWGRAEALLRRAVQIAEGCLGPEDPQVATFLNSLASLLQVTNRSLEAEPLVRRALAIDEQSLGADHPNVARDLNNLAKLLQETNRLEEAEPLLRRALFSREMTRKKGYPKSAGCQNRIRVFVCSSFRDMMAERDVLMTHTWPELRRFSRERQVEFVEVDLRWGITEEQSTRKETLKLCLDEINACRPYFIGLLGERYGWVPGDDTFTADLEEEQPWLANLRGKSVTELQILHGVLNHPERHQCAFFYFRDPAYAQTHGANFLAENPDSAGKLIALKGLIRDTGFPIRESYPDPKTLASLVLEDLKAVIDRLFPMANVPDPLVGAAIAHEAIAETHRRAYVGQPDKFAALDYHMAGDDGPLVLLGESGSGKSALLANWLHNWRQEHPRDFVFQHYTGGPPDSADHWLLIARLIAVIKDWTGDPEELPNSHDYLLKAFPVWLAKARLKAANDGVHFIVVLDAINQLEDRNHARLLGWLPEHPFTGPLRLIVSTLTCDMPDVVTHRGWKSLRMQPLTPDERRRLIADYLRLFGKKLDPSRLERITTAPAAANPLYLKILLDELRVTGTHERLDEKLAGYLAAPDIPALLENVLARWRRDYERDRPRLVGDALGFIWTARRGLTENELLRLLKPADQPQLPLAIWTPLRAALEDALLDRSGILNFAHDFLRAAVGTMFAPDLAKQGDLRLQLTGFFEAEPVTARSCDELPWLLWQTDSFAGLRACLLDIDRFLEIRERDQEEPMRYWVWLKEERTMGKPYLASFENWSGHPGREDSLIAHAANELAVFLSAAALHTEAETLMRRALAIDDRSFRHDQPEVAAYLNNLAALLQDTNRLTEAEPLMRRALAIDEQCYGAEHPSVAIGLNNLAKLFQATNRPEEAEPLLRRALAIDEQSYGTEHPSVARDLNNLARLFQDTNRLAEAEPLLRRAIAIDERAFGQDHPKIAIRLNNLAQLLQATNRLAEAEPVMRRALAIWERSFGPEHPDVATALNNLGLLLKSTNHFTEAEPLMRRALVIWERSLGPSHPIVATGLNNLAQLLKATNRLGEAEPLLQRAKQIVPSLGDEERPSLRSE